MSAELEFHIEQATEDYIAEGLSPAEARTRARREFGSLDLAKEELRDTQRLRWLTDFARDVRYAFRGFRHTPGFTLTAILILGLGIGASTAVFTVVNAVILKPLAFPEPDRLMAVSTLWKQSGDHGQVSQLDFLDWKAQSSSFSDLAYYSSSESAVRLPSGGEFAQVAVVSSGFFQILGVASELGRGFSAQEMSPGGPGAVIISDAFWRSRFGAAQDVLGQTIEIRGRIFPVVGVMPPTMRFPNRSELWLPLESISPDVSPYRSANNFHGVGRLKDGVTVAEAQAEMTLIGNRLERQYPDSNAGKNVVVTPLGAELVAGLQATLYLLLGAVLLLLLIACTNVANLLLAQGAGRVRELGLRAALGASRSRIVRQLGAESLMLGLVGGVLGVLSARFIAEALIALAPPNLPRLEETAMDGTVLVFALGLTLGACLLCGVLPAWKLVRIDLAPALGSRGTTGSRTGGMSLRRMQLVAEIALSVMLLAGAGLLIQSFARISSVDLGFDSSSLVVMETSKPVSSDEAERAVREYQLLLEELATVPGITAVGATRTPPGTIGATAATESIKTRALRTSPRKVRRRCTPSWLRARSA